MKLKALLNLSLAKQTLLGAILLFGMVLRFFLFFGVEKSLWLDEAAIALNVLDKSFLEFFKPLQYAQSAPPLFLCLVKALVSVFDAGERVLRFIPFLCSVFSVFAFYFLSKEIFKRDYWFCVASLFIFSSSVPLLYNTVEFKPYSADILFAILTAIVWFKYLSLEMPLKKEIGFGVLLSIFPLFSFGSVFPLCAVLILSLLKKKIIFASVLIFGLLIEYLLIFSKITLGTRVYEYWIPYFINYNPLKAVFILIENIKYYFYPSNFVLLGFGLFIAGLFFLFKENKKVFNFFGLTFLAGLLASFFNFYPLYERLSLFLYPITLVVIFFPLYYFSFKKSTFERLIISILTAIFLLGAYFCDFKIENYKREEIKPLLLAMQNELNKGDRVFVFKGAHLTYRYYAKTFFKDTLGNSLEDTFVCPYNMTAKACANEVKLFCNIALKHGNSCYILYSSEGADYLSNTKLLEEAVAKFGGKLLLKEKASLLYKVD